MKKRKLPFLPHFGQKGQSLIILAFSFVALVGFLGLALDLGLFYIERTALKRAIDAAALSGVTELSNEEEAITRAIDYLNLNGYDTAESNIYVRGCVRDVNDYFNDSTGAFRTSGGGSPVVGSTQMVNPPSGVPDPNVRWAHPGYYPYSIVRVSNADLPDSDDRVRNVFLIDTYSYQSLRTCSSSPIALGDANKISITGTVKVDMNFMMIVPPFIPIIEAKDHAVAQNMDNLDVVVVFDRSGSMKFDPVCYNCYERTATADVTDVPRYSNYYTYPGNGTIYPLGGGFNNLNRIKACTTPYSPTTTTSTLYDADRYLSGKTASADPGTYTYNINDTAYTDSGSPQYNYMVLEAELYSLNPAPVDPTLQEQGKAYWAMQRGEGNYNSLTNYASQGTTIDSRPAHMAVHPSVVENDGTVYGHHYTLAEAQSGNAPWIEYDFRFLKSNWTTPGTDAAIWVRVHAGRGLDWDNGDYGDPNPGDAYWGLTRSTSSLDIPTGLLPGDPGVDTLEAVQDVDPDVADAASWYWVRLADDIPINTTRPYRFYFFAGSAGYSIDRIVITNNPSGTGHNGNGSALDPTGTLDARTASVNTATAQRTACDACNVLYAQNITTPATQCTFPNPRHPDFTLLTTAQNNATAPNFDDYEMPLRRAKEAIKFFANQLNPERDQLGFTYYSSTSRGRTELACQRAAGANCATGSNPISYTNVLRMVEDVPATGGTPTPLGMQDGLQVLGIGASNVLCNGTTGSSCSRGGGAQKVMILMTDGMPNSVDYSQISGCTSTTAPAWETNDASHRCSLYLAQQATEAGVTVYTIGLGFGVNRDYLKEIASLGNGQAYFSASGGDLKIIFNQILSNIYVRLIQ